MIAISNNVKLQDLRGFTVQIRRADDQIDGTGFTVDARDKIVTCAHVIKAALGKHPRDCDAGQAVTIYYPTAYEEEKKRRSAKIIAYFEHKIDDLVLLQLDDDKPLPDLTPAIIGPSGGSEDNPFRAYGYSALGSKQSRYATGTILGKVDDDADPERHAKLYQLDTTKVRGGMSGAPVLDQERNLVVGLITSTC